MLDRSSKESGKRAAQGNRREEKPDTNLQLMTAVKPGEIENNARIETPFSKAEEETTGKEPSVIVDL